MKKIIICGDCGSKSLTKAVLKACSANGGVFAVFEKRIFETSVNPEFLVISEKMSEIDCDGGIIVFGKSIDSEYKNMKIGRMISVLDTSNINALNIVHNSGSAAVGCSMSGYDTLSVSGLADFPAKKMISLQRSLRTLDGEIIEPHDFLVKLTEEIPVYPLLASCSVLLLSGICTAEGYEF